MATTASRTTSTIAATVALTAAVAVWQYQQRSSKYTSTSGKDDSVDTTARDIDSSINGRLEAPQEVMIQSSPVKPSNNPTMEEDSVSVTDRSSSSESDPEATASDLDKTMDEDDNAIVHEPLRRNKAPRVLFHSYNEVSRPRPMHQKAVQVTRLSLE